MAETRLTKNRCCGRLRRNSCPRSDDRQSFPSGNLGSKNLSTKAFPGRFCSIVFPTDQLPGTSTGQLWPKETLIVPKRMTTRKGFVYALLSVYNKRRCRGFSQGVRYTSRKWFKRKWLLRRFTSPGHSDTHSLPLSGYMFQPLCCALCCASGSLPISQRILSNATVPCTRWTDPGSRCSIVEQLGWGEERVISGSVARPVNPRQ